MAPRQPVALFVDARGVYLRLLGAERCWTKARDARDYGRFPPDLRWGFQEGTHQVGWFDRKKPTVSKRVASATPPAFAQELIDLAAQCAFL